MVTRSHAVAGRNIQKTIPQDRNFFMRSASLARHVPNTAGVDRGKRGRGGGRREAVAVAVEVEAPLPGALPPASAELTFTPGNHDEFDEQLQPAAARRHRMTSPAVSVDWTAGWWSRVMLRPPDVLYRPTMLE